MANYLPMLTYCQLSLEEWRIYISEIVFDPEKLSFKKMHLQISTAIPTASRAL